MDALQKSDGTIMTIHHRQAVGRVLQGEKIVVLLDMSGPEYQQAELKILTKALYKYHGKEFIG